MLPAAPDSVDAKSAHPASVLGALPRTARASVGRAHAPDAGVTALHNPSRSREDGVVGDRDKDVEGRGGLLERSDQLAMLEDSLAAMRSHRTGRVVLLKGEAGIGKSALLRHFCSHTDQRVRVIWSACDPLFTPRPLGPLLDVARATGGELEEQVEAAARPHDVAAALMRELGSAAPTVLVLEDLHWADEATLDVLRLVARRVREVPALVLASYREEELHRSHPLRIVLGDLSGADAIARIELSGLSLRAIADLAGESTAAIEELYAHTGGNPFYVTEALAAKTQRVPDTVREAVLARAARLTPAARELLEAVSVVPQRAEMWLVEALVDDTHTLEQCIASGMLRAEADAVVFRHELARLAIEQSMAPNQRVAWHRMALSALLETQIGVFDLARVTHHAAAAGDAASVLHFAPPAAERASAVGAHREAEALYAEALRFADGLAESDRVDLLRRFADECFLTDMREESVEALDEALQLQRAAGDTFGQGDTQRLRCKALICCGRAPEARAAAEEAIALLETEPPGRELALAYACLCAIELRADKVDEAIAWGTRAMTLAEELDCTEALVWALDYIGCATWSAGGREKVELAISLAERAGLAGEAGEAYVNLLYLLEEERNWAELDAYRVRGEDYCREHGLDAWMSYMTAIGARSHLMRGMWSEAADAATSLIAAPTFGRVGPRHHALVVLALVRARRGDPGSWPLLDEALEIARATSELQFLAPTAAARAEVAWLEGRHDAIAAEIDAAYELALELGDGSSYTGDVAVWRMRAGLATDLSLPVADPYASQLAGDPAGAARWWITRQCPYEAALALADTNDEGVLREAHARLRQLGADGLSRIVARRLRLLGARDVPRGPRSATAENPSGLTARQVEVLRLLARGLRNTEIAERLVVSQKTVEHHVSAILGKLRVRSRGEASAAAVRLGLASEETSPQERTTADAIPGQPVA
jgi:DNA-binding CsgD family transcriptional regulator